MCGIVRSGNKVSTQFTYTHTEKAAFIFTCSSILLIILGVSVFVTQADVDFSCKAVEVACGHVPDTGSNTYISVDASFSFRQASTRLKVCPGIAPLIVSGEYAFLSTASARPLLRSAYAQHPPMPL